MRIKRESLNINNLQYNMPSLNAKNVPEGRINSINNPYGVTSFKGKNTALACDTYETNGYIKTGKKKNGLKVLGYLTAAVGFAALVYKGVPILNDKIFIKNIQNIDPRLKEFYLSLDKTAQRHITKSRIAADLNDTLFLKGLSLDYVNTKFEAGSEEVRSIASVISKKNSYMQEGTVSQFKKVLGGGNEVFSDRVKRLNSTFDKLNNKLKDGKTINSFAEANKLIDDGVGTRAVFKSLTGDEALDALKKSGISDDEITILKSLWAKDTISGLDEAQAKLLVKANNILAETQSQGFVDKLCRALSNNEISMTKLENYAGEDGIAYFSEKQIRQIYEAWEKSLDAKNGATFDIVTKLEPDSVFVKKLGFSENYIKELAEKSSKPSGYTACQANFTYKNGAFGEGQFRGANIQDFAEYEHFPYDIKKEKNTVTEKISELIKEGKNDVANELSEYQDFVKSISGNKEIYGQYNTYFKNIYNYLRKDELGILDIIGKDTISAPKLNIKELSPRQNELLSKECLESLSKKCVYQFQNAP